MRNGVAVAALVGVVLTQTSLGVAFAQPLTAPPPLDGPALIRHASAELEWCATTSRASLDELRGTSLQVVLPPRGRARVTITAGPTGPTRRALEQCLTGVIDAALRGIGRGARPTEAQVVEVHPFASLTLPMEPLPTPPRAVASPASLVRLRDELARASDDRARVAVLEALEREGQGVTDVDAATLLDLFTTERRAAAGRLCRIAVGRRALQRISAPLSPRDRRWLRAATRGQCGSAAITATTATPPLTSPRPLPGDLAAGCTTASDCVLACPAAPDCCAGQCGCGNAILATHEAAARATCRGPLRCPAVACAMEHYTAVCRAGRCEAVRGLGVGPALE